MTGPWHDDRALLVDAIAGAPVRLASLKGGAKSYTDGATIYLAPELSEKEAMCVLIAHALLIAGDSLAPAQVRKLRGRPSTAQRYFTLEVFRCAERFQGLLPRLFLEQLSPNKAAFPPGCLPESAEESLQRALAAAQDFALLPDWWGTIRPFRLAFGPNGSKGTAEGNSPFDRLVEKDIAVHGEDDELDDSGSNILRLFSSPLPAGAIADYFLKMFGFGRSPDDAPDGAEDDGGAMALTSQSLVADGRQPSSESRAVAAGGELTLVAEAADWCYPEWDAYRRRYKTNWVRLSEVLPPPSHESAPAETCALAPQALRKHLAKVGVEFETWRRQPKGDDLDLDRLVERVVERRQGQPGKDNVYQAGLRTRRDLSVLVLLDCSQSTGDDMSSGRTVFGQQREIARAICATFHLFGDRVALYGFHSWGRHLVRMLKIKTFDERMSLVIHQRLDALAPSGLTRMGAAIRHATHILDEEKYNTHRLILMLTDGFSYDDEYEGRYAEEDTARALREAMDRGIACVCANVSSEKDDASLRRLYGSAAYVRCADMAALPASLRRMMQSAVYMASKARKYGTRAAA